MQDEVEEVRAEVVCKCCGRFIDYKGPEKCPWSGQPLRVTSYKAVTRKEVIQASQSATN